MREVDAVYGGEMSAHHYFRDFAYCDSGMIPWLLIAGLISQTGRSIADMVAARALAFPCSGEINSTVTDPVALLSAVEDRYAEGSILIERLDGLGMEFDDWRFNLRLSNTEPVVRLNVESRGDGALMKAKTEELLALINA
jgi:phosphomannomutase